MIQRKIYKPTILLLALLVQVSSASALELSGRAEQWLTASEADKKKFTENYARSFAPKGKPDETTIFLLSTMYYQCAESMLTGKVATKDQIAIFKQQEFLRFFDVCFVVFKKQFEQKYSK